MEWQLCAERIARRLRIESLEQRRMLTITVDSLFDEMDGSITDGDVSLRDAIAAASSGETIDFSVTGNLLLDPELGEIVIDKTLEIAGPGAVLLKLDAGGGPDGEIGNLDGFSIFSVSGGLTLSGVTLTGADSGGAIINTGDTTVQNSVITGNGSSSGGGIFNRGTLLVSDSLITENTAGSGYGGGISNIGTAMITGSVISNNVGHLGAGFFNSDELTLIDSEVNGHQTGQQAGIQNGMNNFRDGNLTLQRTTLANNSVGLSNFGSATLTETTISHSTSGGITNQDQGRLTISHSTIAFNQRSSVGGGIFSAARDVILDHTIVAHNTTGPNSNPNTPGADIWHTGTSMTGGHNLVGILSGTTDIVDGQQGNQIGGVNALIDVHLSPLDFHGGKTRSHALLDGSPAIDAGDPTILFDPAEYDQRGAPFPRVSGPILDIGAFEAQADLSADFDADGDVDGVDFLAWQRGYGISGAVRLDGDANGDDFVDDQDLALWQNWHGGVSLLAAGPLSTVTTLSDAILAEIDQLSMERSEEAESSSAYFQAVERPSFVPPSSPVSPRLIEATGDPANQLSRESDVRPNEEPLLGVLPVELLDRVFG